jgi:hypothetical protein
VSCLQPNGVEHTMLSVMVPQGVNSALYSLVTKAIARGTTYTQVRILHSYTRNAVSKIAKVASDHSPTKVWECVKNLEGNDI